MVRNAHRVYGKIHIPLLAAVFEILNAFHGERGEEDLVMTNDEMLSRANFFFVLKKLKDSECVRNLNVFQPIPVTLVD